MEGTHSGKVTCVFLQTHGEWNKLLKLLSLSLQGPKDTPYEGGVFMLMINVPEQYPLTPPGVRYRTKVEGGTSASLHR